MSPSDCVSCALLEARASARSMRGGVLRGEAEEPGAEGFRQASSGILGSGLHFPSHPSGIIPSLLPVTVNTPLAFGPGPVGLALPQRVLFFCKGAPPCPFHAGPPKIPEGTRDSTRHPGHRDWGLNPLLPHWVTALTLRGSLWISNTKWGP